MKTTVVGMVLVCSVVGCASSPAAPQHSVAAATPEAATSSAAAPSVPVGEPEHAAPANGPWIGASGASDFVLAGTRDTFMGVWVDVPSAAKRTHSPMALSLVIDTSGSMGGAKIENARSAARALVGGLANGDIVAIDTFSDDARER